MAEPLPFSSTFDVLREDVISALLPTNGTPYLWLKWLPEKDKFPLLATENWFIAGPQMLFERVGSGCDGAPCNWFHGETLPCIELLLW